MSNGDYTTMSNEELRRYFLRHREDKMALRAYLDRLGNQPHKIITTVDDPDFEIKIQAAILPKMQAADKTREAIDS